MDNVNRTLYIPLYGKAYVSRRGLLLEDPKAEQIWETEGFPLKGKAKSKWLAYNMGMRSAVFDRWLRQSMADMPEALVLHGGCGLDSRCVRVGVSGQQWYDVDFPEDGYVVKYREGIVRDKGFAGGAQRKAFEIVLLAKEEITSRKSGFQLFAKNFFFDDVHTAPPSF